MKNKPQSELLSMIQSMFGPDMQVMELPMGEDSTNLTPMNRLRSDLVKTTKSGDGGSDPCLDLIVGGNIDAMAHQLIEHADEHCDNALHDLIDATTGNRDRLKLAEVER